METFTKNRTKYKEIKNIIDENSNCKYHEWLEFEKVLDKPGKQGVVGLFQIKNTKQQIIFKISQYINYLVFHELQVMNFAMNESNSFLSRTLLALVHSKMESLIL